MASTGAYFMEMDFFDGHVVDGGFGLAEFAKNGGGVLADVIASVDFCRIPSMVESERCAWRFLRCTRRTVAAMPFFQTFSARISQPGTRGRLVLRADVPGARRHGAMRQGQSPLIPLKQSNRRVSFRFDFPPVILSVAVPQRQTRADEKSVYSLPSWGRAVLDPYAETAREKAQGSQTRPALQAPT